MQWEKLEFANSPKMKGTAEFNGKFTSRSPTLSTEEDRRKAKHLKQRLDSAQVRLKNLESGQSNLKRLMRSLQTSFDELDESTGMDTEEERKKTTENASFDFERFLKGASVTASQSIERKQEKLSEILRKMKVIRRQAPHCDKTKILLTIAQKIARTHQKYYDYPKENNTFLLKMLIYTLYQELENLIIEQAPRASNCLDQNRHDELIMERELNAAKAIDEKTSVLSFIREISKYLDEWVRVWRDCQRRLRPEKNEYKRSDLEEKIEAAIKETERLQEDAIIFASKYQDESFFLNSELGALQSNKADFLSCNSALDIFHLKNEIAKDPDLSIIEDPKSKRIQDLEHENTVLKNLLTDKNKAEKDKSFSKPIGDENANLKDILAHQRIEISRLSTELLNDSTLKDNLIKQLSRECEILKEASLKGEKKLSALEREKEAAINDLVQELKVVREQLLLCKTEKNYFEKDYKNFYSSSIGVRVRELNIRVQELEQREHQLLKEKDNVGEALKAEHEQNLFLSKQLEDCQKKLAESFQKYQESLLKYQEMQDEFAAFKRQTELLSSNIEALEHRERFHDNKERFRDDKDRSYDDRGGLHENGERLPHNLDRNSQAESLIIQELSLIILSKTGGKTLDEKYKAVLRETYGEKMATVLEKYCERLRVIEEEKEETLREISFCNKRQDRTFELAKFFIQFTDHIMDFFSKLKDGELVESLMNLKKDIDKKKKLILERKRAFAEELAAWNKVIRKINEAEQAFHRVIDAPTIKSKDHTNISLFAENEMIGFLLCQASSIENLLTAQDKSDEDVLEKRSSSQNQDIDNIEERCTEENEDEGEEDKMASQAGDKHLPAQKLDQKKQFEDLMQFLKNKHKISD